MGIQLIPLLPVFINLIKAIFGAEKTKTSGNEKELIVINQIVPQFAKGGKAEDIIRWTLIISKIIAATVKILNDVFGKNGWNDEPIPEEK